MFIDYGVSDSGELIYIGQVQRGATELHCPYCGGLLTAKKGQRIAHHFAHTGETCRQAERDQAVIALPMYDSFNLHLSGRDLAQLKAFRDKDYGKYNTQRLEWLEVVKQDTWTGDWELTKLGKVPFGDLSLMLFNQIQEPLITEKHDELEAVTRRAINTVDFQTTLTDLRLYRAQWRRLLSCTLYFLSINDGQLHKIGVTTRDPAERIAEVKADLVPHLGAVKIETLGTWRHRGNVELYFKHRYKAYQQPVGTLTEYFKFDPWKPILSDLRRMKAKELTPLEQAVLDGQRSDLEREIENKAIEQRRLAGISAGMRRAAARGQTLGRPVGAENTETFLAKPDSVAVRAALDEGLSLRQVAQRAGVSVNTVRKVKAALENT